MRVIAPMPRAKPGRSTDLTKFGEMRLLNEALIHFYPDDRFKTRVRLGSLQPTLRDAALAPDEVATLGPFRRWADGLVFRPDELVLVEAAVRPETGEPSKLEVYSRLVRVTPELEPWYHLPVVKELIVAIEDPVVSTLIREQGGRVKVYRPEWLPDYFSRLFGRETRPPQNRGFGEAPGAPAPAGGDG